MNDDMLAKPWQNLAIQPEDVRETPKSDLDALIISAIQVDGDWVILSRYEDDIWQLTGFTTNVTINRTRLNFKTLPPAFRALMKAILYRYLRRGRRSADKPKGNMVRQLFNDARPFLRYLEQQGIEHFGAVPTLICASYVTASKAQFQTRGSTCKPLSARALQARFVAVEALYELSQYTNDRMLEHPWPDTSAKQIAGLIGSSQGGLTPLIPDDVFCTLFKRAYEKIENGKQLLELRDTLYEVALRRQSQSIASINQAKNRRLKILGWEGGLRSLNRALIDLRTACYIVLASTSGCRQHELTNLQLGASHRTQDDDGNIYHWMRSRSEKTYVGIHNWMIPEAAVRALRMMERWCAPYQTAIVTEILQRRRANPRDPQITEAQKHRHALFLSEHHSLGNQVRTLTNVALGMNLKKFAKDCGLSWDLASHQFRRKFANYAAHSRFGDLRYLKEHFAHWTLDMTLGYAYDDSCGQQLDLELYADVQAEIEDIKLGVVNNWLENTTLAGNYGRSIVQWRREPKNLLIYKDRASMVKSIAESTAIRSNGHAYCTADNDGCIGNTLERTRCANCNNAVIEPRHAVIYQRLYDDLKELLHCQNIGESGRLRVERDLNRCRDVLIHLGIKPELLII
ncbi:tyrosine-type recombinase/integrase [Pseudomonas sp. HMWF021]|uniref:tyrosine-type recombinase/integrase n=1 Tax=Pseudomonas sp. HMWF021 TaxID=2056857 RepID=UPI000D34C87E|nr:tyrosine-type recombinase/integrase [Pseudomonas sp. HMWF021]PTT24610.1 integrase [Pseudomonas sp. HMWF021]